MSVDTIGVLIVDDHDLARAGLRGLLEDEPDVDVLGELESGFDVVAAYRTLAPTVVLMDLRMPAFDGIHATAALLREYPDAKVLIISSFGTQEDVFRAHQSGARGYLLKESRRPLILEAVRRVAEGQKFTPPALASAAGGEREKIVAARAETMGAVKEQIAAISPKLSTSDRERLASHLDLVSAYQSRLAAGGASSCSSLPTMGGTYKKNVEDFNVEFGRLVAHAFACDVTRVASLQMADFVPESFGASGSVHDAMAHNNGNESGSGAQNLKKYNLAVAATVGRIAAEFSRLGLLDSTLIVWMSEHGLFVEPHVLEEMPVVVIGNVGGHFKTGRYISVARTEQNPRGKVVGRPHNLFLVSLMQAMGLPDNFLNVKTWYNTNVSGPLPELV